jgi:pimeloyl-ACP methyl ester carboxylesterase
MKLDITERAGNEKLPACVFIHGLGMNKLTWTSLSEANLMGGSVPIASLLKGHDLSKTLYHDMIEEGCPVMAWSQRRPLGPAAEAVKELKEVMARARRISKEGVVLIGHSRGGLIARAALPPLSSSPPRVRALVTLCSPHGGSALARWARHLSPLASRLYPYVEKKEYGKFSQAVKRMLSFLTSQGVAELLPGSPLISSLSKDVCQGIFCFSCGGTRPLVYDLPGVSVFPQSLVRVFPERRIPMELRKGEGDGLVSVQSSVLPGAEEHVNFGVNHVTVLVDPYARATVRKRLRRLFLQ